MGYACTERRQYEVDGVYEGSVICRQRRRRISHGYTLLSAAPLAVDTESDLRAAWANPRVTAIDVTADIFLRACERNARVAAPGAAGLGMARRCGRRASRSGSCARTGPATSSSAT